MLSISASAYPDSKPHYAILDGLRGVASLVVVAFHLFEAHAASHADQIINHSIWPSISSSSFRASSSAMPTTTAGDA